jgi:hypothetical protein
MEKNLVYFPNSMYPHVGPYTPYFGFSYEGIRSVPTIWPLMSNPLTNPTLTPKLVLGITQDEFVTNHEEPLGKDHDFSKESITLGCQESFLLENHVMDEEDLRLKMLVGLLLMYRLHLLAMMVVDLLAVVVTGL